MPNDLKCIRTLKSPAWVFWRNRNAAFQALGDRGQDASDDCLRVLADILCDRETKPKWRIEATVALRRIGARAVVVAPAIEASLCNLHGEWSTVSETASCMIQSIEAAAGSVALAELLCRPALREEVKLVIAEQLAHTEVDTSPAIQQLVRCLEVLVSDSELSDGMAYAIGERVIKAIALASSNTVSGVDGLIEAMVNLDRHASLSGLCNDLFMHIAIITMRPQFSSFWPVALDARGRSEKTSLLDFFRWWEEEGRRSAALLVSGRPPDESQTSNAGTMTEEDKQHTDPETSALDEGSRLAKEWWQSPASAKSRERGYAICDDIDCGAHIPPGMGHIRENPMAKLTGLDMPPEIVCDQHELF